MISGYHISSFYIHLSSLSVHSRARNDCIYITSNELSDLSALQMQR